MNVLKGLRSSLAGTSNSPLETINGKMLHKQWSHLIRVRHVESNLPRSIWVFCADGNILNSALIAGIEVNSRGQRMSFTNGDGQIAKSISKTLGRRFPKPNQSRVEVTGDLVG